MVQAGGNESIRNGRCDKRRMDAGRRKDSAIGSELDEFRKTRIQNGFSIEIKENRVQILANLREQPNIIGHMEHGGVPSPTFRAGLTERALEIAGRRYVNQHQRRIGAEHLLLGSPADLGDDEVDGLTKRATFCEGQNIACASTSSQHELKK